jgi:apolipoprotein N-acyltransferase
MAAIPETIERPESPATELKRPGLLTRPSIWAVAALVCFYAAYQVSGYWMFGYLYALLRIARSASSRGAFYLGLGIGFLSAAAQLGCFWTIFGLAAIVLWLIIAFWTALFVCLARLAVARLGDFRAALLIPFLWTGLEYFRSELYYLKFSWVNFGYAFAGSALQPLLRATGMYGLGFLAVAAAVPISGLTPKKAALVSLRLALIVIVLLFALAYRDLTPGTGSAPAITVAGMQLEFPGEPAIIASLEKLRATKADLIVLSEYTLDGPVPDTIRTWCREHAQFLVIGGKDPVSGGNFYDTAFVVGPTGEIVFRQAKSVPIQFFKDGLPAAEQTVWNSPWGKIGFCVCYDLSYSRVTDQLIRLGARAIVVPTMDVIDWGKREHELHGRVGLVRAAEYGVPVLRVASSGISQVIDPTGREVARADFPGQGEILSGSLSLARTGTLPLDRWLGPVAACVAAAWLLLGTLARIWRARTRPVA